MEIGGSSADGRGRLDLMNKDRAALKDRVGGVELHALHGPAGISSDKSIGALQAD